MRILNKFRTVADDLTPEQRRRCMAAIRSKHTKPEMLVRRLVHALGFRYRLHRRDLPGRPDLVLPKHRKVINIHGCFWHAHSCRAGAREPTSNVGYWTKKRAGNAERDRRSLRLLQEQGWRVLTVWECQTKDRATLKKTLTEFLAEP